VYSGTRASPHRLFPCRRPLVCAHPLQIQFFVFRCYACGAGIRQMQLVCGVWRGPSSNLKAKMALSNIRAPVLAFFDGCKDMEMTAWEDVSDGVVAEKLSAGRAGFKPTHFEFGTGNEEDLEYDELQALEEERRRKEEEERIAAEGASAREGKLQAEGWRRQERGCRLAGRLAAGREGGLRRAEVCATVWRLQRLRLRVGKTRRLREHAAAGDFPVPVQGCSSPGKLRLVVCRQTSIQLSSRGVSLPRTTARCKLPAPPSSRRSQRYDPAAALAAVRLLLRSTRPRVSPIQLNVRTANHTHPPPACRGRAHRGGGRCGG
jgi:hypothetical protein